MGGIVHMPHTRTWIVVLIVLMSALVVLARCLRRARANTRLRLPQRIRRLWPCTPDDCPACCLAGTSPWVAARPAVRPWREGRSRRGAPRRVPTDGYACHRPGCLYQGITDAQIHALVADGHQGR